MNDLKQMGRDCMALIIKKMSADIDPKQYCDGLLQLHQKYPINGHEPPLTTFQLKNYKILIEVYVDPDTDVKYIDHLQPWNFDEAAQMYYWHSRPDYGKQPEIKDGKAAAAGEHQDEVAF